MTVDEEVHDSEGGSPNVDGTNTASLGGDDAQSLTTATPIADVVTEGIRAST